MAYRGEDTGDALEAPTAEGLLEVVLGPNRADLSVAHRTLHIAGRIATVIEHKRQKPERRASVKIGDYLVVARGVPREDVGIWVEHGSATQRIFGVQPVNPMERDGLGALGRLDAVVQRLRGHLAELAGTVVRAVEIGAGHPLDKVLLADHGDHYVFYARRLFRDRARHALSAYRDGRIVIPEKKTTREIRVASRYGITVRGDYVRFADHHGTDLARVAFPWLAIEDREEVARRIAQIVER